MKIPFYNMGIKLFYIVQYKQIGVPIHPPDPSLLTVLESRKNNTEELSSPASVGTHLRVLQWLSEARHVDVNCLVTELRGKILTKFV